MKSPPHITPFSIQIGAVILSDLRERIRKTRWPGPAPGAAWEQGTDLQYLRLLLAYWADEFDWRAQERELNVHEEASESNASAQSTPKSRLTGEGLQW